MKTNILVVTSTKQTKEEFKGSMFHNSVWGYTDQTAEICPVYQHTKGIADAYNRFLVPENADRWIVFMHADASLHSPRILQDLEEAFEKYDVVGVAGAAEEFKDDVGWAFTVRDQQMVWKDKNLLSGAVFHTDPRCYGQSNFGTVPKDCAVLDGVFLAINGAKVIPQGIQFDPSFKYDFYDIDFCHQCRDKGLKLGTWPFAVTHASGGRFGNPEWQLGLALYKNKWYGGSNGNQ